MRMAVTSPMGWQLLRRLEWLAAGRWARPCPPEALSLCASRRTTSVRPFCAPVHHWARALLGGCRLAAGSPACPAAACVAATGQAWWRARGLPSPASRLIIGSLHARTHSRPVGALCSRSALTSCSGGPRRCCQPRQAGAPQEQGGSSSSSASSGRHEPARQEAHRAGAGMEVHAGGRHRAGAIVGWRAAGGRARPWAARDAPAPGPARPSPPRSPPPCSRAAGGHHQAEEDPGGRQLGGPPPPPPPLLRSWRWWIASCPCGCLHACFCCHLDDDGLPSTVLQAFTAEHYMMLCEWWRAARRPPVAFRPGWRCPAGMGRQCCCGCCLLARGSRLRAAELQHERRHQRMHCLHALLLPAVLRCPTDTPLSAAPTPPACRHHHLQHVHAEAAL